MAQNDAGSTLKDGLILGALFLLTVGAFGIWLVIGQPVYLFLSGVGAGWGLAASILWIAVSLQGRDGFTLQWVRDDELRSRPEKKQQEVDESGSE